MIFKQLIDVSPQLYGQIEGTHILHKKCDDESSGPIHMSTERNIPKEEMGLLRHPPTRPSMDCQVSSS
jgi:serine carboxypeptidase-like clade 1